MPVGALTPYSARIASDRQSWAVRSPVYAAGSYRRSGSGKTDLTFMLMLGMMKENIKILALGWKRGYRDLLTLRPGLHIYTIGRDVSPFRFNPLIPSLGCEPNVWIKLIVDVIGQGKVSG